MLTLHAGPADDPHAALPVPEAPAALFLDIGPDRHPSLSRTLLQNVLVAAAYILTGYLGLRLAFVGHSVTLFWPPSGIAFAALWIGGRRLLPSLVVGAFTVNLITTRNPELAGLITIGNTTSTIAATYLVRRRLLAGPHSGELHRVMAFILLGVLSGTVLSASVGTAAVNMFGHVDASLESTWLVWWMGDAMGVLIVTPPILLWPRITAASKNWRNIVDAIGFAAAGFAVIAGLALLHHPIWAVELCKLFTLLLSLWAGARFGLNGPAAMTLLMAAGTVSVTVLGIGPFVRGNFYDSFASLHSYLFAEAVAGMLLAAALADLRRAVAREHDALREVEAASTDRIRLMSMISHDLRTPLAGIMGVMQTLDQLVVPVEQSRLVAFGLRAGSSLTMLISDILDIARVDTGQMVLHPAIFSPAQSLEDVVATNQDPAFAKTLKLTVELAAALPAFVLGDRVRFEQIVGNLVVNAVTHTDGGHILVRAEWDGQLIVEVIDSGPGIAADLVPHIFDAFVSTRPRQSQGLGLGLHICRQLTELMQGSISYHRVMPAGSRFRVSLPLPGAHQGGTEPGLPARYHSGFRILLVDDDDIALAATSALLTALGHDVTAVETAETAIRIAASQGFDIVLMDIQLRTSALTGLDGVRAIRALPGPSADCLILMLTGSASPDQQESCLRSGVDGVLVKPFAASLDLGQLVLAKRANNHCLPAL